MLIYMDTCMGTRQWVTPEKRWKDSGFGRRGTGAKHSVDGHTISGGRLPHLPNYD